MRGLREECLEIRGEHGPSAELCRGSPDFLGAKIPRWGIERHSEGNTGSLLAARSSILFIEFEVLVEGLDRGLCLALLDNAGDLDRRR
jgi:hypothetical protein